MEKCEYCGRTGFKNKTGLSTHQRIHCTGSKKQNNSPCDCKDGGSWEFVNGLTDENGGTINPETGKKYKKICVNCREVI